MALDLETEGGAETKIEQAAATAPEAKPEEAPDLNVIGSPSPLKSSGGGGISALLATVGLAAIGLFLARWVQGGSSVQGKSTSNEVVERTTDTSADAVKSFAEGRAAAKADGGAGGATSGESVLAETAPDPGPQPTETASDPVVVGWVPGKRIRLLIADGHPTIRADLRDTLESHPNLEVVGEATTGAEAVKLTERLHPRVVLMDLHVPEVDGTAATAQIKARYQDSHVLVMATQGSDADIPRAIETGASGYLLKDAPREELLEAIRAAAQGKPPLPLEAVREGR